MTPASLGFVSFAHPALAIAGVLAVAIPILIHLLMRRRRRPVPWGAMRFLAEAIRRQRRRMKIQQWLLLAARCLLVALVGLAIARPMLGGGALGGTGPRTVVLLVDNSITASLEDDAGRRELDGHLDAARALLESLDEARGDRAALIALGAPAEAIVFPPSGDLGGVAAALERVAPTAARADVGGALALAASLETGEVDAPGAEIALLSAARAGSLALDDRLGERGLGGAVRLIGAAEESADNVAVVEVSPLRRVLVGAGADAGLGQVRVRLARWGPGTGGAGVTRVTLRAGVRGEADRVVGAAVVRWTPGQTEAEPGVTADFGAVDGDGGALLLEASIDADALGADNTRSTLVRLREALRVGIVGAPAGAGGSFEPADWARLALAPGPGGAMSASTIRPGTIDAATLAGLDAVVVTTPDRVTGEEWARLRRFVDSGGMLLIAAAASSEVQVWTDAAGEALGLGWSVARDARSGATAPRLPEQRTPYDELLALVRAELEGLLRPVRVSRWLEVGDPGVLRPLLALEEGSPWLLAGRPEGGERGVVAVLLSALDLGWTDLPAKPLVVPMLHEVLRQGAGLGGAEREQIAGTRIDPPAGAATLAGPEGAVRRVVADDAGPRLDEPVRTAGVWRARSVEGAGVGTVLLAPDVRGSATDPVDPERLRAWLAAAGVTEVRTDAEARAGTGDEVAPRGPGLGLTLLLAAAALGLAELALARWASHPRRDAAQGAAA